jgi:hypothetical protein
LDSLLPRPLLSSLSRCGRSPRCGGALTGGPPPQSQAKEIYTSQNFRCNTASQSCQNPIGSFSSFQPHTVSFEVFRGRILHPASAMQGPRPVTDLDRNRLHSPSLWGPNQAGWSSHERFGQSWDLNVKAIPASPNSCYLGVAVTLSFCSKL